MKFTNCEKEIQERAYLINAILEHHTGTHKIRIISMEPKEIKDSNIYYIQCNYYKELAADVFTDVLLSNKLNDLLQQYIPY